MDLQAEKTIYLHKGRMKWRRIGIKGIKDRNRVLREDRRREQKIQDKEAFGFHVSGFSWLRRTPR